MNSEHLIGREGTTENIRTGIRAPIQNKDFGVYSMEN